MGQVVLAQGDYDTVRKLLEESLALLRELGDKFGIAGVFYILGNLARTQGDYMEARSLYEESLTLCSEMNDKWVLGGVLLGLGLVGLDEGAHGARGHILQSLSMFRELGEKLQQTSCLIGVAGLALQEGDSQIAAQLLGAVKSALEELNVVVAFDLQLFHTQTLAAVRERLGESAFQSAWEVGEKWSLEDAIRFALEDQGIGNEN
jgi:tetratricopeptide (TPR) repeat protein